MTVKEMKITDLHEYENNPRHNEGAVAAVAASIKEFGFKVPIVIDQDNVIIAGHTRLKAAQKLGLKAVPCIVADDLTPDQVKAFRLADNRTGELAEWDYAKLDAELAELAGFNMAQFGFDEAEAEIEAAEEDDGRYTDKINVPTYEPLSDTPPDVESLCDTAKRDELLAEINKSGLSKKDKEFLRMAATRHIVFDYKAIAEYYAHANPELQDLMEKSALVIIDYDKAIENGYVKIKSELDEMREALEDNEDEE